jgi:hypothetical protein
VKPPLLLHPSSPSLSLQRKWRKAPSTRTTCQPTSTMAHGFRPNKYYGTWFGFILFLSLIWWWVDVPKQGFELELST